MALFPSKLVIVRHAESERNLERERVDKENSSELVLSIKKRDPDIELTKKGIEQATLTGSALKKQFGSFDVAFVSPYTRTRQTADLILKNMNCKCDYRIEDRIREKEFGVLDMLTKRGVAQKFPDEHERKQREGKYYYRPPGGESYADVGLRLYSFMGSMMRSGGEKDVLVVTHSVVVKMLRKVIEKLQEEDILKIDAVDEVKNCGVTYYSISPDEKLKLEYYNKMFY